MARIVRIATTSIATLEDTAPPFNLRYPKPQDTLALGLSLLDAAGAQGADLALLPEGFMAAGLPAVQIPDIAEPLGGPSFRAVAERAKRYGMYIVAGFYAEVGGTISNLAALIDRNGELVGTYSKQRPTEGEIDNGVMPGTAAPVFETDFGRVALAICFDLNWPDLWAEYARKGAEIVCWISAYEGGFPLQASAWTNQYAVVSSVWPYHARVIEKTGRIVAQTSRWGRLAFHNLNLDKRLFHTDGQMMKLVPILTRYGEAIRIETFHEEHLFTIESVDPALSVDTVIAEFGLVEYRRFIDRCTWAQAEALKKKRMPEPAE
ncbi:MAG TPA: carbon-nitrogen hydrolase family protein [Bauldia sp.]|nr:carbon-nitrogen hydrolase family protein [Bauldia sp.]